MSDKLLDLKLLLSESIIDEGLVVEIESLGLSSLAVTQVVHRFLSFDLAHLSSTQRDAVIRLAIHLSPPEAIQYNAYSTKTRWMLIRDYISSNHVVNRDICERISRKIAGVLDMLEIERDTASSGYRQKLFSEQKGRCRTCGFLFGNTPEYNDPYKPYYESWEELTELEVDHKTPICGLGDNQIRNLQLLCRLCNWGKGFGIVPSAIEEYRFAAIDVSSIERYHRCRCFYNVLIRDKRCVTCGETPNSVELTVRKKFMNGPYSISNLCAVCRPCRVKDENP
jgi:hypothetical protein